MTSTVPVFTVRHGVGSPMARNVAKNATTQQPVREQTRHYSSEAILICTTIGLCAIVAAVCVAVWIVSRVKRLSGQRLYR